MKLIYFVFLLTLQSTFTFSQDRINISGTVTDFASGEPIYFVNVFLSNTTLGCATDIDGNYAIFNVRPGYYELVASMIGYEIERVFIRTFESQDITVHFELKPKVIKGKPVSVTA